MGTSTIDIRLKSQVQLYSTLSQPTRRCIQVWSLYGLPAKKRDIKAVFQTLNDLVPSEFAIDYESLRMEYERLFDGGFLSRQTYSRDAVDPNLRPFLMLEAHRDGNLSPLGNAIVQSESSNRSYAYNDRKSDLLKLRLQIAFYANDVEAFAKLRSSITIPLSGQLSLELLSYFDEEVFRSLDSSLQQCWLVEGHGRRIRLWQPFSELYAGETPLLCHVCGLHLGLAV